MGKDKDKDEGPLPHYPAKWERDAAKHARRAAGHQITTEDRLAYAQERSAADHDHNQAKRRADRRDAHEPLDALNLSEVPRVDFMRLHDALIVDEAGLPRLRPDFLRYLDDVAAEASLAQKAGTNSNGNGHDGNGNGNGAQGAGEAQEARTILLDAWAGLAQVAPEQCHILYLVHVLGESQSRAAEVLGIDRMVLAKQAAEGRAWIKGFMHGRRPRDNGHALRGITASGAASGAVVGLVSSLLADT